mgnify:CR=1 FL=1
MDSSIERLVEQGLIYPEDAFEKATDKQRFIKYLKEIPEEYREMFGKKEEGQES